MNSYLYLKFFNISKEKIIIKLKQINVNFYDLQSSGKDTIVKINNKDYEKITKYLFYPKHQKIKYTGPIYFKKNMQKYLFFVISFIFSVSLIFLLSNVIVDIEVVHEDSNIVNLILKNLEENGVKKFHFRKSFNSLSKIKEKIKNDNLDQIEWLEIERKGMKYFVKVEERIVNVPKQTESYCHVYATKEGLVSSIKVAKGVSLISLNDYVKKGDILISGDVVYNENIVSKVCAEGSIYANTWYKVNISLPVNYTKKEKTGKKRYNFVVDYNGIEKQIFKDRLKNYKSQNKLIFNLLGFKIYLKTDEEIIKTNYKYTLEEGVNKALELAREKVQISLNKSDEIIEEKVLQNSINDSTISVDVFIVAKEQIGIVTKVEEGDNQ